MTDCRYVKDGIDALAAGRGRDLLDGEDADLWERISDAPVIARWVPAHLDRAETARRGVIGEEWVGNDVVDRAARASAQACGPPAALVERRTRMLGALEAVHRSMVAMQRLQLAGAEKRALRKRRRRVGPRLGPMRRH